MKVCLLVGWRRKQQKVQGLTGQGILYTDEFEPVVYGSEFVKDSADGLVKRCWPLMVTTDTSVADCETCKAAKKIFDRTRLDIAMEHLLGLEKK